MGAVGVEAGVGQDPEGWFESFFAAMVAELRLCEKKGKGWRVASLPALGTGSQGVQAELAFREGCGIFLEHRCKTFPSLPASSLPATGSA